MKNFKYTNHVNPYKRSNPDLDELRDKIDGDMQYSRIQKKLAKIGQDNNPP